ncbi:MAG: glycosyltransferase family 4 protein [Planctomycetota bacterium]|nr:glycosyltransferase family 4 protein [Planctomycetota bacterium]
MWALKTAAGAAAHPEPEAMRIAFDASGAARNEATGVAVYIRRTVAAVAAAAPDDEIFVCYRLSRLKYRRNFFLPDTGNCRIKIIQEPFNPFFQRSIDIFHGLDARLPSYRRPGKVVTIHDMFSAVPGGGFAPEGFGEMKRERYRNLAEAADVIVAVSGAVRSHILEALGVPEDRVRVVYEAPGPDFRPEIRESDRATLERLGIRRPYLLYVGSINRRKNVRRMVEAFSIASEEAGGTGQIEFVLAGRVGFGGEEALEAIRRSPARDRIRRLGYVADGDLPALYRGALGLVFATLYEGFGLPVVEAFACGCPVLISRSGSLPEVAGGAAIEAEAEDADAIADGMRRLMRDQSLRGELRAKGIARAAEFSWEKSARALLDIYRGLVAGK